MRWLPVVSRSAFEIVLADRDFWRTLALESMGAAKPAARLTTAELANAAFEPWVPLAEPGITWADVGTAVSERAGANGALRAHLAEYAQQERTAGRSNEDIVKRVTDWSYRGSEISPTKDRDRADAEAVVSDLLDND